MAARLPLSPRLRMTCLLILLPIIYLFLIPSHSDRRPVFDPYAEEAEDGYRIHLTPPTYGTSESDGKWGVTVPGLDKLKGLGTGFGLGTKDTLLITGGAGQLGQALLPRLVDRYNVHVLDIASKPANLPTDVVYHRGSATNPATVRNLLSAYAFKGIIHFATVSLDTWCVSSREECEHVNEGAAREVIQAVAAQASKAGKSWRKVDVPWMIMGSTVEVYGSGTTEAKPESLLGKTMLMAEEAFLAGFKGAGYDDARSGMQGMILRFSDVYGYAPGNAIEEGLIPGLVRNALSSLAVQYDSDAPPQDLLHVDDAVAGVLAAMEHVRAMDKVETVDIVTGRRWQVEEIVERTRAITLSKSPIVDIGDHRSALQYPEYDYTPASRLLGWTAMINLPEGLQSSITMYTQAQHTWAYSYLQSTCPSSTVLPAGFTPRRNPADERNKPLHKLDKCLVSLAFNNEGYLHHVKCQDGQNCGADQEYVDGYNWNATYWVVHADKGKGERKARLGFEEEKGMGWLGMRGDVKDKGEARWRLVDEDDAFFVSEFDVEVAEGSSQLTLSLPNSHRQVYAVSNVTDYTTWFSVDRFDTPHFDMRMTVVCCPTEGDWPLLMDDFETADVRFGSTGQIPFNASRRSATCDRAEEAWKNTRSLLKRYDGFAKKKAVEDEAAALEAIAARAEPVDERAEETVLPMTHLPSKWALRELPTCWNDCSSPLICVSTGACRCVWAECPALRDNPLFTLRLAERRKAQAESDRREAQLAKSGKKPKPTSDRDSKLGSLAVEAVKDKHLMKTLVNDAARVDLHDVLLPAARAYIAKHPEFIKVFVIDDTPGQAEIEQHECHKLKDRHCFSADNILYKGFRRIQVATPEEADLLVLPVYQQCKGVNFTIHDVQGNARDNITGVRNGDKRIAAVLTHDWGICVQFAWEMWSARVKLFPDYIVDNTLIWSVMGDYDSPCYRPHQDVVIPARSCRSNTLRETFPTIEHIRPMRQRHNLMTWAGTYWGTGKNDRLRLTCGRGGAGEKELIKGMGKQDNWISWDYMNDLSNARFCPQPRGIAGWSPRTNDAIFAGCIPVIIAEGSHYPYATLLDWSKFSVRIQPTDLDHIEQILSAIPLERIEEMQANLAVVREGFLYSSDDKPEEETVRKGPMWFALHEAGMRLRTRYPVLPGTNMKLKEYPD